MRVQKLRNFFSDGFSNDAAKPVVNSAELLLLCRNFEESCKGWFWSTDASGNIRYLSESLSALVGDRAAGLTGTTFADLFAPASEASPARDRLPFNLTRRSNFDKLTLQTASGGSARWWEVSGCPQFDGSGEFTGFRGYGVDVTEQRQSSEHASKLAAYDPLTGLPNRLRMAQRLEASLASIERTGRTCAILLIDLDRFKQVNDTLGHLAGDALLKKVAERLIKIVGDKEKVFRLGGDEFQVIMPDCEDRGVLGDLAQDIIASLSQPYSVEGSRCVIGASLGLAIGPFDGVTSEELMRNVDLALYAAKGSGRGCFRFFSNDLLRAAEERRGLEEDLRDALTKGQLSLAYQPIVHAGTNRVTGVEALLRWDHATRGMISPALFIPIAEESNLIEQLGEWTLRQACADAATWPGEIRVAVNVSPVQFINESLPGIVVSALANAGLAPNRLELELTEGVFLSESSETDTMFMRLKDIGVRLALDDFGTGYSSLGYLKTAPFDKIKIDQSFVRDATVPGSRNGAIIAAIVALAGALDMETTAEGIESLDQLDLIRQLQVSHVQGYVFSEAVATGDLSAKLDSGDWVIAPSGPARQRSDRRAMYRKAGAIVGGYYHPVLIRNLSETGTLIDGLTIDLPAGAQIIIDFGECQLSVATVRRSSKPQYGVEFGQPLVSDGIGGLCTSHRVSPYILASSGLSTSDYLGGSGSRALGAGGAADVEGIARSLGLALPGPSSPAPTHLRAIALPPLGGYAAATATPGLSLGGGSGRSQRHLSRDELQRLKAAVESSHNQQLKVIVALQVLTGIRLHDLLRAHWDDIDFEEECLRIPNPAPGERGKVPLCAQSLDLLRELPRWEDCVYLITNPRTKKPYNSFFGSWDAARKKAGLHNISMHDLRSSAAHDW